MKSAIEPAFESVEDALESLEVAVEKLVARKAKPAPIQVKTPPAAPQLALSRNENEINRKIAVKLDQTISRLETLLSEDA